MDIILVNRFDLIWRINIITQATTIFIYSTFRWNHRDFETKCYVLEESSSAQPIDTLNTNGFGGPDNFKYKQNTN